MKAAVLTVSDGVVAGEREDASGDALEELLAGEGYDVVRRVVPDEREQICGRDPRSRRRGAARPDDGRDRRGAARRDARGDARRARP